MSTTTPPGTSKASAWRRRNLAADPDGFRERQRQRAVRYRAQLRARAAGQDVDCDPFVPIGPWAQWLAQYAADRGLGPEDLGPRLDLHPSRVREFLDARQARIRLGTVDRLLCALNEPGVLNELYPPTGGTP